jgi:hypothetical protein
MRAVFASVNFVSGLVLAAFSATLLWVAYLPHEHPLSDSLDGMYWPRLVLWGLLAFSLLLASERLWLRKTAPRFEARESEDTETGRWPVIAIACCLVYIALIGIAGFLLSTLLFCAVFPVLLGLRDWMRAGAFSLIVTSGVWLVVIVVMRVTLPRGIGVFREISLYFY